jgi:hypothetical protein
MLLLFAAHPATRWSYLSNIKATRNAFGKTADHELWRDRREAPCKPADHHRDSKLIW